MQVRLAQNFRADLGDRPDGLSDCGSGGSYGRNAGQLQLRRHADRVRSWLNPRTRYDTPPVFRGHVTTEATCAVLHGTIREAASRTVALPATLIVAAAFAVVAASGYLPALIGTGLFAAAFLRFLLTRQRVFTAHATALTAILTGYVRGSTRADG